MTRYYKRRVGNYATRANAQRRADRLRDEDPAVMVEIYLDDELWHRPWVLILMTPAGD